MGDSQIKWSLRRVEKRSEQIKELKNYLVDFSGIYFEKLIQIHSKLIKQI